MDPREDPNSYSRPDLVAVTHTRLELSVNFQDKVLKGNAILTIDRRMPTCNELVLDTYGLEIFEVKNYRTGRALRKNMGNADVNFGSKLIIELPNVSSANRAVPTSSKKMKVTDRYEIQIEYQTSPESPALYWLEAHQTSDGVHPLLISNSKLIYARAIFPCQDTPSNRITFDLKMTLPRGLNVMMPGTKRMHKAHGQDVYTFTHGRNITMAPYEIYIIVGSLREEGITDNSLRCNLWTEEKYLPQGRTAISKINAMLLKIKQSYNFSAVGEVNVCVLPPNVPEFDMQYPHVTFVSSTLLEGHYSMIDTIVQNIIESWIVRKVRIEHFKHLWLIKGLSTFIYRNPINDKIIDEGMKFRNYLEIKGINNLLSMPQLLDTVSLVPAFTDELLPMNITKYVSERGCVFLNYLQDILGGPKDFKTFLVHKLLTLCDEGWKMLTTERFKHVLYGYFAFKDKILNTVDWDKWFNEPLFPPSHSYLMTIRKTDWQGQVDQWIAQETACFGTIEKLDQSNDLVIIEFLTYLLALPTVLPEDKLRMIEHAFLRDQKICEIRFLWLRLCMKSEWFDYGRIQKDALEFACDYSMPKYAYPIFRDLYKLEETRNSAISWFMKPDNRSKMLPETINKLSSILGVRLDDKNMIIQQMSYIYIN